MMMMMRIRMMMVKSFPYTAPTPLMIVYVHVFLKQKYKVVVSSECSTPIRFGFSYGEGTLLFTVPAGATNQLIRVSDEVSVVREPRSSQFQAFDTCSSSIDSSSSDNVIMFHEIRLGSGVCPGFDSPPFGACMETSWVQHMDFIDSAFRNEDEENIKSGDIRFDFEFSIFFF
jgi:hypothetical protein